MPPCWNTWAGVQSVSGIGRSDPVRVRMCGVEIESVIIDASTLALKVKVKAMSLKVKGVRTKKVPKRLQKASPSRERRWLDSPVQVRCPTLWTMRDGLPTEGCGTPMTPARTREVHTDGLGISHGNTGRAQRFHASHHASFADQTRNLT